MVNGVTRAAGHNRGSDTQETWGRAGSAARNQRGVTALLAQCGCHALTDLTEPVLASEIDFRARESSSGIDFILVAGTRLQANRMHLRSHCAWSHDFSISS
jgi:hypothetical protein